MIDDDAFSVLPSSPMPPLVTGDPVFSWCNMCLTTSHCRIYYSLIFENGMIPDVVYWVGCMRCDHPWQPTHTSESP